MLDNERIDRFHNRKNPRLRGYDYTQPNWYFVTICTHEKRYIFGEPGRPSGFGRIAGDAFGEISKHFPAVQIDKFVVMPNHVHAIIHVKAAGTDLPLVLGQYKAFVTKQIHAVSPNCKVWQTSFHDHVIRNSQDYRRIWEYIDTNPVRWREDCFFCGQQ